jgi:hypothetical protein
MFSLAERRFDDLNDSNIHSNGANSDKTHHSSVGGPQGGIVEASSSSRAKEDGRWSFLVNFVTLIGGDERPQSRASSRVTGRVLILTSGCATPL